MRDVVADHRQVVRVSSRHDCDTLPGGIGDHMLRVYEMAQIDRRDQQRQKNKGKTMANSAATAPGLILLRFICLAPWLRLCNMVTVAETVSMFVTALTKPDSRRNSKGTVTVTVTA